MDAGSFYCTVENVCKNIESGICCGGRRLVEEVQIEDIGQLLSLN
jgi:hypothetical protein